MSRYPLSDEFTTFTPALSVVKAINDRQRGLRMANKPQLYCHFRPNTLNRVVDTWDWDRKILCGKHIEDGKLFVACGEQSTVALYDASWEKHRQISQNRIFGGENCFLDLDVTPDQRSLILCGYSSIHMISNFRDLDIAVNHKFVPQTRYCNHVFSVKMSSNNTLLTGACDGLSFEFDMETKKIITELPVCSHRAHVYTVGFVDESPNVFYTGTAQGVIRLWDRRTINVARPCPIGKFIGHHGAVTHIDSRKNGRHLLSQSMDQSIKLWDLRRMLPSWRRERKHQHRWSYTYQDVNPQYIAGTMRPMRADNSIMMYRGHYVWSTLMRAKFSPALTTGQRYIYTGCATGRVIIYDVLTGKIAENIEGHSNVVSDVSWHPYKQEILTCASDCCIHLYTYGDQDE